MRTNDMKFLFGAVILILVAAQSWAQGCSGGSFSQNIRERHVVRAHFAARGGCSGIVAAPRAGCVGHTALVPQTVMVPKTVWTVAPCVNCPVQAPAAKMPVGNGPLVYAAPFQTEEPRLARNAIKVPFVVIVKIKDFLVGLLPHRSGVDKNREVHRH
jgi:hypothetical protein